MNILNIGHIENLALPLVYERGREIFDCEIIEDFREDSRSVTARVEASGGDVFYTVHMEEDDSLELSAHCNCPYEGEKFCKHIIAVFLEHNSRHVSGNIEAAKEEKDKFEASLLAKSKEELVKIINEGLPEEKKEELLLRSIIGGIEIKEASAIMKKKINETFRKNRYFGYKGAYIVAEKSSEIVNAIARIGSKNTEEALELLGHFFSKAKNIFNDVDDSGGSFGMEISAAGGYLTELLDIAKSSVMKNRIIKTLYKEWCDDGYGYYDCLKVVLESVHLTKEETNLLIPDIEKAIKDAEETLGNETDGFNKTSMRIDIQFCVQLCAFLRVNSGETQEGISFMKKHLAITEDYETLGQILMQKGYLEEAENVLKEGLLKQRGLKDDLFNKLIALYEDKGDSKGLADILIQRYKYRPSLEYYKKIKSLRPDNWQEIKGKLILIAKKDRSPDIIVDILIEEKELLQAYELILTYPEDRYAMERFGKLFSASDPEKAIFCFQKCVEYIVPDGSTHYWKAVGFIDRIEKLCKKLKKESVFQQYIDTIRIKYRLKKTLIERIRKY